MFTSRCFHYFQLFFFFNLYAATYVAMPPVSTPGLSRWCDILRAPSRFEHFKEMQHGWEREN